MLHWSSSLSSLPQARGVWKAITLALCQSPSIDSTATWNSPCRRPSIHPLLTWAWRPKPGAQHLVITGKKLLVTCTADGRQGLPVDPGPGHSLEKNCKLRSSQSMALTSGNRACSVRLARGLRLGVRWVSLFGLMVRSQGLSASGFSTSPTHSVVSVCGDRPLDLFLIEGSLRLTGSFPIEVE